MSSVFIDLDITLGKLNFALARYVAAALLPFLLYMNYHELTPFEFHGIWPCSATPAHLSES